MKVILVPLLLSSLTLLSPAGHASGAPGVSVGFSPEGSAEALVLGVIDRAQAEIRLAGYSFTSPDVATALVRAKARGVDVRVVLDEKANQNRKSQVAINVLTARDIPVRLNGRYAALHDKFIIADGRTVETGSVNYTRAAPGTTAKTRWSSKVCRNLPIVIFSTGNPAGTPEQTTDCRTDSRSLSSVTPEQSVRQQLLRYHKERALLIWLMVFCGKSYFAAGYEHEPP